MYKECEVKVTMSLGKKKSVSQVFKTDKEVKTSTDDAFLKDCVSVVLKNFDTAPEKIKVTLTMSW